jgi:hypothetical protein
MRFFGGRELRLLVGACVVVGVGAITTVALGVIPDSNGVIHGCYPTNSQNSQSEAGLVLVNGTTCPRGETAISWNQTGPTGATGNIGPTGATGATGASGASGASGPSGATGPQGPSDLTPAVGSFTPTQLVQGAVLTCATFTSTQCTGMKLNGLDVRLDIPEANRICNTVRGTNFNNGVGTGVTSGPHFFWNGTNWTLTSSVETPMNTLNCN